MIQLKVSGPNFDDLRQFVDTLEQLDLRPLAEQVRGAMVDDNRDGLLAGTDIYGDPMAPVEESTIRRGRGGDGEPLSPRGLASRVVSDYQVELIELGAGYLLRGSWPNTPFVNIHEKGYTIRTKAGPKAVVARDIVGIRPTGEEEIGILLDAFCSNLLGAAP